MKHFISKTAFHRQNVQTHKVYPKLQLIQMYFPPKALLRFDMEFLLKKQGASHEFVNISQVKHKTSLELHHELA